MPAAPRVALAFAALAFAALFISFCGCSNSTADRGTADSIADAAYLTAPFWNDGEAELAFYRLRRSRNQYGADEDQEILVGTYLVKHEYDPAAEAKAASGAAETVSAFKYALFYEFESGSYEYKRSYVVNARQADLRPLKHSFNSFDWCSNIYKEQAFAQDGRVEYLMRSDDYGNARSSFRYADATYPPALVPLVVRGMDFGRERLHFGVLLDSGAVVSATAERVGGETIETEAGSHEAERIVVTYDGEVPSPFAEQVDPAETYWRGIGPDRLLLAVQGATGAYRMDLVEAVRSPYWEENVYAELQRVRSRP